MNENDVKFAPGSMPNIIFRRSPPGQYDHAPQGTLCVVNEIGEEEATYKQSSEDESNPEWMRI